jgi:hypothetical protein
MAAIMSPASAASRYSLRCFIFGLEFAQRLQCEARFFFIHALKSETSVGQHVFAGPHVGRAFYADASVDASEADVGFEHAVTFSDAENLSGDG